jgi:hypothetical protein
MNSSSSSSSSASASTGKPKPTIREGNYLNQREGVGSAPEVDLAEMIEKSKCSELYYRLEECLGEYNREWRKCQSEVKALKECSNLPAKR